MSEKHVESRVLLLAAEKIRQLGERDEDKYHYKQLTLEISYDGYTLIISDRDASFTLYFHNTIKMSSSKQSDLDRLYKRLCRVAAGDE